MLEFETTEFETTRQATILRLIDEVESIRDNFNANSYYGDSSYKELIDSALGGKLRALRQYADAEGCTAVVAQVGASTLDYPEANAVANFEGALGFVIPET